MSIEETIPIRRYPMRLESWHNAEQKQHWKIVRRDNCTDIDGMIIMAFEDTGEVWLDVNGITIYMNLGHDGIKIIPK